MFNESQCRPYKTIARQADVCRQTVSLVIKKYKEQLRLKEWTHLVNCSETSVMKVNKKADLKTFKDPCTQADVTFKSITNVTAESCLLYLYESLRNQIDDVDYFIIKANNLSYKCRIVPEDDRDYCLASLKSLERSICTQLVHISNTLRNLTNVCLPLGACMDGLMKIIMLHYICLKNLTKHFLNCCSGGLNVSIQGTKFDSLLKVVGKPLPSNIYALITYIESNILEETSKKKTNPQAEKAKVLRETKFIPKIILCIENFNKHVILLAKKTNDRLANFLHFGTVRDFRIKTSDLKAAIDRTLSHSSQIEATDGVDGEDNANEEENLLRQIEEESRQIQSSSMTYDKEDDAEEEGEQEVASKSNETDTESCTSSRSSTTGPTTSTRAQRKIQEKSKKLAESSKKKSESEKKQTQEKSNKKSEEKPKKKPAENEKKPVEKVKSKKTPKVTAAKEIDSDGENNGDTTLITPDDGETLENESNRLESCTQLMKNLAKINAKTAKKRSLRDSEQQEDPDVLCAPPLEPIPKKSKRTRKGGK